jgi:hypothetical protein
VIVCLQLNLGVRQANTGFHTHRNIMFSLAIFVAFVVALQADTVVAIGMTERDLTGDGQPEMVRLVGVGRSVDSLDVTLSIESAGATVYRARLFPMTRTVGFDRGRRRLSRAQHRQRLAEFGKWFFGPTKFKRPPEFVKTWGGQASGRIARIPSVIARDRKFSTTVDSLVALGSSPIEAERAAQSVFRSVSAADSIRAVATWEEIQESGVTLFQYSAGGDHVTAIGWSARDRRFYRLVECC